MKVQRSTKIKVSKLNPRSLSVDISLRFKAVVFKVVVVTLLTIQLGTPCTCVINAPLERYYTSAEYVFLGSVISTQITNPELGGYLQAEIEVLEDIKNATTRDTILVKTATHSAACGFSFADGSTYVLFTNYMNVFDNVYSHYTNSCVGNILAEGPTYEEQLDSLRALSSTGLINKFQRTYQREVFSESFRVDGKSMSEVNSKAPNLKFLKAPK